MVIGFPITYAISAYHHYRCEFETCSLRGVLDTTLCDKVWQWLATGLWFSPFTPVSSTNKTDRHDITEILLKAALNTITPPTTLPCIHHWWTLFVTTLTTVSLEISQLMICKIWWIRYIANYATVWHKNM
jgi:hypothetical protein